YSMRVDANELGETQPSVEWLEEEGYWSVQIPVPDTLNQAQDWETQPWAQISVEISSAHFDSFPVAMMITVMDIDPVGLDETLNPDNSTVFNEIEDFTAITKLVFDKWAPGHDDFSDEAKQLGTLVIDTELIEGLEPLNLCILDQDHQPVTAQALMNLQENMDIAAATMSLSTAEEGMTGFGKPSRLTMYNLEFEESPGVLYVTDEGEEVIVVEQDSGEILDNDRIAQYIWDPETRTLTLDVTKWSTYKAFYDTETSASQEVASSFDLQQNYPNPFNPSTQIWFSVPEQTHVRLTVYNMLGQQVETLANETRSAGWHHVTFDATGLSSGMYIYRIEAGEYVKTRQMMLVK
ncbi:T9SS type A sorting domain-containing protein, partial [Balneolaceae bacterium ANBcel3]|nr:T9SS type A sorting domain-containing protein [Balneolaceae bacterium ANBcel3]